MATVCMRGIRKVTEYSASTSIKLAPESSIHPKICCKSIDKQGRPLTAEYTQVRNCQVYHQHVGLKVEEQDLRI